MPVTKRNTPTAGRERLLGYSHIPDQVWNRPLSELSSRERGAYFPFGHPDEPDFSVGKGVTDAAEMDQILGGRKNFPNWADDNWKRLTSLVSEHGYGVGRAVLNEELGAQWPQHTTKPYLNRGDWAGPVRLYRGRD